MFSKIYGIRNRKMKANSSSVVGKPELITRSFEFIAALCSPLLWGEARHRGFRKFLNLQKPLAVRGTNIPI